MKKNRGATLFVGDINVDVMMGGLSQPPVVDREVTCTSFAVTMGSSAVISASAFAALGGASAMLGLAGQDAYGDFMLQNMVEAGIDTTRVLRTKEVGTGVTVNLIEGRHRTQITYPGTIAAFRLDEIHPSLFDGIDHVHLAGPYQQTNFRPSITRFLDAARAQGVTTSLDPQWDETEKWDYMSEWLPRLDFLFVNEDEAMSITATATPEMACRALDEKTALPIIKLGARGSMALWKHEIISCRPIDVKVVDTTGAGDNFDSAFLFATRLKDMDVAAAMEFANAAASRSVMFTGGCAARSTYEDVIKLKELKK